MDIVGAYACSHSGLILTRAGLAPPDVKSSLFGAFLTMGDEVKALAPDALVVIGCDHGRIFEFSHVPQFTIGVGSTARSMGDAGLPEETVPINQPFAQAILGALIDAEFDVAYSEAMRIDHSFIAPFSLAFGHARLPIVPIIQNCFSPPLPTLRRSYHFGRALGQAIRGGPPGRIVLIGTGGLSHWVGAPRFQQFMRDPAGTRLARKPDHPMELTDTGRVNEEFDRTFIDHFNQGKVRDFIADWNTERVYQEGGNGGQEIRNWLAIAGAVDDAPAELIGYGAVAEWLTGTAVARVAVGGQTA